VDNLAVIALATALELEFAPLLRRLQMLAGHTNPTGFQDDLNNLLTDLPSVLGSVVGSVYAANVLESILATHYAEGIAQASRTSPRTAGKLLRPEQAYAAIRASGALAWAPNSMPAAAKSIKVRAQALSKVIKGQIIQDLREDLRQLDGESFADAKEVVATVVKHFEDLSGDAHVNTHVLAQTQLAQGYGIFSVHNTDSYLRSVPFQEFYRAEHRVEWRDWPERWNKFGGRFFPGPSDYAEGRMIAETGSKIWEDLSNPDFYSDATGSPYPPFAYNSGMSVKPVDVKEAARLGLHGAHKIPKPKKLDFNASIQFSVDFDDDIKSALLDNLLDWEIKEHGLVPQ
jgi:hypothetical protein